MNIKEILSEMDRAYPFDIFPDLTKAERDLIVAQYPGFIDRIGAQMGRHLVNVISEKLAQDKDWRERYEKRLIARGFTRQDAHEDAEAADNPDNDDPEGAADDEYDYAMTE